MKTTKHSFTAACAVLALLGLTGTVAHAATITFEGPDNTGDYGSGGNGSGNTFLTTEGDYRADAPTTILPGPGPDPGIVPRGGNDIPGLTLTYTGSFMRYLGRRTNDAHTGKGTIINMNDTGNASNDPILSFSIPLNITSMWLVNDSGDSAPILGLDANNNVLWSTGPITPGFPYREFVLSPAAAAMATHKLHIQPTYTLIDDISATAAVPEPTSAALMATSLLGLLTLRRRRA